MADPIRAALQRLLDRMMNERASSASVDAWAAEARAALATVQPAPETAPPDPSQAAPKEPTDEELDALAEEFSWDQIPTLRAALARWRRVALAGPAAPAVGEVEELARWLEEHCECAYELGRPDWAQFSRRAAALLRQLSAAATADPAPAEELIQAYQAGRRDADADAQRAAEDPAAGEEGE